MRTPKKDGKQKGRKDKRTNKQIMLSVTNQNTNMIPSSFSAPCLYTPPLFQTLSFKPKLLNACQKQASSLAVSTKLIPGIPHLRLQSSTNIQAHLYHPYVDLKCQRHSWEPGNLDPTHCFHFVLKIRSTLGRMDINHCSNESVCIYSVHMFICIYIFSKKCVK